MMSDHLLMDGYIDQAIEQYQSQKHRQLKHKQLKPTPFKKESCISPHSSVVAFENICLQDMILMGLLAFQEATKVGVDIVFSFVDSTGSQRYFFAMDNALLVSHELAMHKAWTAVALKASTLDLATQIQPGQSLYGLQHVSKVCCIAGGVPIWLHGKLIGAIGISGGTVEQDCAIANNTLSLFF